MYANKGYFAIVAMITYLIIAIILNIIWLINLSRKKNNKNVFWLLLAVSLLELILQGYILLFMEE